MVGGRAINTEASGRVRVQGGVDRRDRRRTCSVALADSYIAPTLDIVLDFQSRVVVRFHLSPHGEKVEAVAKRIFGGAPSRASLFEIPPHPSLRPAIHLSPQAPIRCWRRCADMRRWRAILLICKPRRHPDGIGRPVIEKPHQRAATRRDARRSAMQPSTSSSAARALA